MHFTRKTVSLLGLMTLSAFGLTAAPPVQAQTTINTPLTGWYDASGFHDSGNTNYVTGRAGADFTGAGGFNTRDYFTFDLSGVTKLTVTSATLSVFNPFIGTTDPTVLTFHAVSTPASVLDASQTSRSDIFTALGSGASYGSYAIAPVPSNAPPGSGQYVSFVLNAQALADIANSEGSLFSLSGTITNDGGTSGNHFALGFTEGQVQNARLVLNAVPEPSSVAAFVFTSLFAAGLMLRTRKRAGREKAEAAA